MPESPLPRGLPKGWRLERLIDVAETLVDGDWVETKDQGGSDYRLLQVSNVGVGAFRETGTFRGITRETFQRLRCTEVRPGDILISRMPHPIGRAWFVTELVHPAVTAVDVAILTPDESTIDGRYLAYYLNSPYNLSYAAVRATGTTRSRIARRVLEQFPVPLPPFEDQGTIVALLASYDELIANNLRRIQILEEMAHAIYQEWFVNFRFPGRHRVKVINSELGAVPEGWKVARLGDHVELAYGKALKEADRRGGPVAVYGSNGPIGQHNQALVLGPGIIVGRKGKNFGAVHWSDSDFYPIDTSFYVKSDLPLVYLYFNLQQQPLVDSHAAIPGLNRSQAYGNPLLVPDSRVLHMFESHIQPIFALRRNLLEQENALRVTRDLLLPKLISGEINVSGLDIDTSWLAA